MYHFLVNRTAGNGRGQRAWNQIQPLLDSDEIPYRVSYPEDAGDAVNHIRSLSPAIETLVVVGGDGTIQSVLAEVVAKRINLGLIPAGSGNDVARSLNIPFDAKQALRHLLSGTTSPIDLIHHGDKCYATAIGVGFDGAIAYTANQSWYKKWLNRLRLGSLTYVFALLQVLFRYQPTAVTLTLDGKRVELNGVWLIAIANFKSYGGGMNICPQAKWDDGYLEVCTVQNISRLKLLSVFPKVYSGTHTTHPAVHMYQAKHVHVTSTRELVAHGDGELVGTTPLDVTLHPDQLGVVTASNERPTVVSRNDFTEVHMTQKHRDSSP